ncbi:hypothetical protein [Phenylobacterium sp.]|uniref:hypothetical protein n=1 Tax=Phenylobacterium sp. TaxID=1871053 RepID=UPI0025F7B743|nr:hypothetical protein [Phenylobacterium sp.]
MTIRRTFLLLVMPLFLLLAGVNGALLFLLERGEAARGIETQAISAAVTTAAFASGADDLAATLADPRRAAALKAAAANIPGLAGLYVVGTDGVPVRIAGRGAGAGPGRFAAPARPLALPIRADAPRPRLATALAAAGGGRFVIAQIDAEPLFAEVAALGRLIAGLVAAAALLGFGLAWTVASRIARELARNSAMVEAIRAGAAPADLDALSIRETRDLANAVRLMKTGVTGRLARSRRELALRDRQRDEAAGVAAVHETAFPPLVTQAAGVALAARRLGEAGAGCFYALATDGDRAGLVLGECRGATPVEALAKALAARRFFERRLLDGAAADRVEQGRKAFDLGRVEWTQWIAGAGAATSLALLDGDNAARAAAYAARGGDLPAQAVADDLEALLVADGMVAVLKPGSAERGQG